MSNAVQIFSREGMVGTTFLQYQEDIVVWGRPERSASWYSVQPGFRHLLFFVNSKNPVFKPFVAYFFVNFLNFICCTELYFYEKCAII